MTQVYTNTDNILEKKLDYLQNLGNEYWSFKGNSTREYSHGLFRYPAMMVPQMVRRILHEIHDVFPSIKTVSDPFMGSGTILTESMLQGFDFFGNDINPMAVLLGKTKSGPFHINALKEKSILLFERLDNDSKKIIEVSFSGIDKWFREDVQYDLSQIKRAIHQEKSKWARRFFWVALAETIRLTSNSRTTTYKLHKRCDEEIKTREIHVIKLFNKILLRNINLFENQAEKMKESQLLSKGYFTEHINIKLGDTRELEFDQKSDLIITSPPYGDNTTTIPYGQYSYLPLQWIDLEDIEENLDPEYLKTTSEIDARSLGGSKRISQETFELLNDKSPALRSYLEKIRRQPEDRKKRVLAFFRDLDVCIEPILKTLKPGGLMVWTLGNRNVGGVRVPLDLILFELFKTYDVTLLATLTRNIESKRMAIKNKTANTMSSEIILVLRKA